VNQALLQHLPPEHVTVEICRAEELAQRRGLSSELDAMWSYVGKKAAPRWLWHAIDHHSGAVLAYVLGRRQDEVFLELKELLAPFGITRFYTDGWGAYERHLDPEQHTIGKAHTQKIERKHINLRTRIKRLVRRTICFSKTITMHDLVLGLFINRYEGSQSNEGSTDLKHLPRVYQVQCSLGSGTASTPVAINFRIICPKDKNNGQRRRPWPLRP
jgi:insertion element IS1 protein InsB